MIGFVIIGLFLILTKHPVFMRNRALRLSHLIGSIYICVTGLIGILFPVAELENHFSRAAGGAPYPTLVALQWLSGLFDHAISDLAFFLIFILIAGFTGYLYKNQFSKT
jgi:hypothetical protein